MRGSGMRALARALMLHDTLSLIAANERDALIIPNCFLHIETLN